MCEHVRNESVTHFIDGTDALCDTAHEMINGSLLAGLETVVDMVVDMADELREAITEASEHTSSSREILRPVVTQVRSVLGTLDDLIDLVQDVASTFSLSGE
jgi:hypothetical protein